MSNNHSLSETNNSSRLRTVSLGHAASALNEQTMGNNHSLSGTCNSCAVNGRPSVTCRSVTLLCLSGDLK